MSLPPQVIQVKRKRTEDGAVPSYLRIEHTTKRHRSDAFLYRRHDPQAAAAAQAAKRAAEAEAEAAGNRATRPPTIQSSRPGDEKRKSQPSTPTKAAVPAPTPPPTAPKPLSSSSTSPRRFHLSRDSLRAAHSSAASVLGVAGSAGIHKRSRAHRDRSEPAAVFVEKTTRRRKQIRRIRSREVADGQAAKPTEEQVALPPIAEPAAVDPLPKRPSRRPLGSGASTGASTGVATPAEADSAPSTTPALPQSLRNRQWDTDMDQLTRDMNDYTLEVIGRNLAAQMQAQRTRDVTGPTEHDMSRLANERRKAAYAKYKPKPAPRYAERRAGESAPPAEPAQDHETESAEEDSSDDDYVTETYVRIPGHEAAKEQAAVGTAAGSVGLLVFDNEPDLEFFYGVEEDSEEDWEDDEDENAENYYTHDYPEDEVSSDDEYGRDAYHYRTGNASDLEEYESDGEVNDQHAKDGVDAALSGNLKLTKPGDF